MSTVYRQDSAPLQPGITTENNQAASGGSSISTPHPDFSARLPDWVTMFDTNEGQRHIKHRGQRYLPATSGMRALSSKRDSLAGEGLELYNSYLTRAFFPDLVKETIRALVGILDKEPANIMLPEALEDMRELATPKGESLNDLLIQMHMQQLLYGRLGLLLDVDPNRDLPLVVNYPAPQILNWDDATFTNDDRQQDDDKRSEALRRLLMVVLDETRYERDTGNRFTWNLVPRYRALTLGDAGQNVYTTMVERDGTMQEAVTPAIRGRTLDQIPFVFCNTTDLATKPGEVPLINLANLALAIYRGEADHRSALFMSGQDTLVIIGTDMSASDGENPNADTQPIIGSGAYINLPDSEADAKFVGPNSQALAEQRTSLENDYTRAGEEGIKLMSSGAGAEAAETLKIRAAARTATLQTIAVAAATALETSLRQAAMWVGADPEEVKVEPNLDFIDETQSVEDLVKFANAKKSGVPLSWQSVHNWMRQKDFTEMTLEEELDTIAEEDDDERLSGGDDGLGMDDDFEARMQGMFGGQMPPGPGAGPGAGPGNNQDEDQDEDQA